MFRLSVKIRPKDGITPILSCLVVLLFCIADVACYPKGIKPSVLPSH